jgi:hypothetical protein
MRLSNTPERWHRLVPENTFNFQTAWLAMSHYKAKEPFVIWREVELAAKRVMFPMTKRRNDVGAELQPERALFLPDFQLAV